MFSKHTFGARTYGHSRGSRWPEVPPMTKRQWKRYVHELESKRTKKPKGRVWVALHPVPVR